MESDTIFRCLQCGLDAVRGYLSVDRHGSAKVLLKYQTKCSECGQEEEFTTGLNKNLE
jgi:transcription elongation factor Elf1